MIIVIAMAMRTGAMTMDMRRKRPTTMIIAMDIPMRSTATTMDTATTMERDMAIPMALGCGGACSTSFP